MITVVPAITAILDKLEKKGYVSRKRCEIDRRVWHVSLTSVGKKLLTKMDKPNLALHSELVDHLTKAECKQLCELLEKARSKDYPAKVAADAPLNDISDTHTLFGGGGARGYTDYPFME